MSQFLTESELNQVKGLIHYLNDNAPDEPSLMADIKLIDSNGEGVGRVEYKVSCSGYVLVLEGSS